MSATNSFTVTVTEVNSAPALPLQTNRTVLELTTLLVTNTATDGDVPAQALTYQLVSPPAGASINTNGLIAWTPAEDLGPGTYTLTTVVTDNGTPALSATNSFTVTVTEVNSAPALPLQTNRTVLELTTLLVTNAATDADIPINGLTYSLVNPPDGAGIDTNGVIAWTPTAIQGSSTNLITTVVTDDGVPSLSATNTFTVYVTPTNHAPVLSAQADRTTAELTTLVVTNTATDADLLANTLAYTLAGAPEGATVSPGGVITWTPTETQGPGTYTLTTVVTDNGVPPLSATNSFAVTVTEVNSAPVLPLQTNQTVLDLTVLLVTNTATDADIPAHLLTYSLVDPPNGAVIDTNGVIAWPPNAMRRSSTNVVTTVVSDNGVPPLSATNTFTVYVTATNSAPMLPEQVDRTTAELTMLVVTNAATDADLPANALAYALVEAPAGATISEAGVITWTPAEAQGPGIYTLTTVVTDSGVPPLSATNSFAVTVTEVNSAPLLPLQTNRTVLELTTLLVTNTATDADIPANALTYSLVDPPDGAGIDTNGVIVWTPTEAQGPGTYTLTTVVTDSGAPSLGATNSFAVTVTEMNSAPVLAAQADQTIAELTTLVVTNTATDDDLPATAPVYTLVGGPAGATISDAGVITWTPSEAQGSGTYTLTTVVTDSGAPPLSATNSFAVTVTEVNSAPVLPLQTNRSVMELAILVVTNTATDADNPANGLSYSLVDPPDGAGIDTNGVIAWTPTETQGTGAYTLTTVATDDGVPPLSATNTFTVYVTATNSAPVLPEQVDRTTTELTMLVVTNAATDGAVPANTLAYALVGAPVGATISDAGVITWTPSEAQGSGTYTLTTVVTDGGVPPLSATNSFSVTVTEVNSAPVLPTQADRTIAELTPLVVTNTAADADLPANALAYALVGAPAGATISDTGIITWTPSEVQGPGTYTLTTVVTDNGTPPLSATNSFAVTVTEVNRAPVLPLQTNRTVLELATLLVTNAASDPDIPASLLTYSLVNPPAGATIDADGVIAWTPTALQGPSTNLITTVVTDAGVPPLSTTNTFSVFVSATNSGPATLFADDFTRGTEPGTLSPWTAQLGRWTVTSGVLEGGFNGKQANAFAYVSNTWTNYAVQAQVQFPAGAYGGGVGAFLNSQTGARYAAWIYPENSPGGSRVLKLLKFQTWTSWAYQGLNSASMQEVSLPAVGTGWHTLTLAVSNAQIRVDYDTNQLISVTDAETTPYTGGGISVDMQNDSTKYVMTIDNVRVDSLMAGTNGVPNNDTVAPLIESTALTQDGVVIAWRAVSGKNYRLQFTEGFGNTNWNDVLPEVLATGPLAAATNSPGNSAQRFYRVMLVQ